MDQIERFFNQRGCLGNPAGRSAFAYLWVRSQDDTHSLQRQLDAIHDIAQRWEMCVTWETLYDDVQADDDTLKRPGLMELMAAAAQPVRVSDILIVMDYDHLSRRDDIQGHLLDYFMSEHGMDVHTLNEYTIDQKQD